MANTQYEQFQLEKKLATQLLNTTITERKTVYKKIYNEFFEQFPNVSFDPASNIAHKIAWQIQLLQPFLNNNCSFMEIGAGNCLLSLKVARRVKHVVAYEVADSATHIDNAPINFKLKVFDGVDFNESNDSFDIIYSNDVFEHLHVEDTFHHLAQYYNILKSNGRIIIVTPHSLTGPHDISRNFTTSPEGFHMKEYTYSELNKVLKSSGFKNLKAYVGHKKTGYFPVSIHFYILIEKLYSQIPSKIRYKLKNNRILAKIFTIKIIGTK